MVHAAHQGDLVHQTRHPRQVLADPHTGHGGGDGLELAAHLGRRVRFEIVRIEMARAAVVEEKYARADRRTCNLWRRFRPTLTGACSRRAMPSPMYPAEAAPKNLRRDRADASGWCGSRGITRMLGPCIVQKMNGTSAATSCLNCGYSSANWFVSSVSSRRILTRYAATTISRPRKASMVPIIKALAKTAVTKPV